MAVYNGERYLRQALDSVFAQTFVEWEMIVVDDGSTDNTHAILDDYAQRDERMRVIHTANGGQTQALNIGLRAARGLYVARLDADDVMYPTRLEKQVSYMEAHSDVLVLGSFAELIDDQNNSLGVVAVPVDPEAVQRALIRKNPFFHSAVIFRKSAVDAYKKNFLPAQDYALWMKLSRLGLLANLPEALIRYRVYKGQMSRNKRRRQFLEGMLVQLKALTMGWYPFWNVIYVGKYLLFWVLPDRVFQWISGAFRRRHLNTWR